jgi:hypothetical protein
VRQVYDSAITGHRSVRPGRCAWYLPYGYNWAALGLPQMQQSIGCFIHYLLICSILPFAFCTKIVSTGPPALRPFAVGPYSCQRTQSMPLATHAIHYAPQAWPLRPWSCSCKRCLKRLAVYSRTLNIYQPPAGEHQQQPPSLASQAGGRPS